MTSNLGPSGGVIQGDIVINGHVSYGLSAPAAAAAAQNGTSPPAPVVSAGANDGGGNLTFGSGASPAAGAQVTVTFAQPWNIPGGGNPHVVISASNAAAAGLGLYITGVSMTGFTISAANAPAASQPNKLYSVNWLSMG